MQVRDASLCAGIVVVTPDIRGEGEKRSGTKRAREKGLAASKNSPSSLLSFTFFLSHRSARTSPLLFSSSFLPLPPPFFPSSRRGTMQPPRQPSALYSRRARLTIPGEDPFYPLRLCHRPPHAMRPRPIDDRSSINGMPTAWMDLASSIDPRASSS